MYLACLSILFGAEGRIQVSLPAKQAIYPLGHTPRPVSVSYPLSHSDRLAKTIGLVSLCLHCCSPGLLPAKQELSHNHTQTRFE